MGFDSGISGHKRLKSGGPDDEAAADDTCRQDSASFAADDTCRQDSASFFLYMAPRELKLVIKDKYRSRREADLSEPKKKTYAKLL